MKFNNILTLLFFITFILFSCHNTKKINGDSFIKDESILKEDSSEIYHQKTYYKNHILNKKINTVLCHKKEDELSLGIINLNSDDKLSVSFDDFDADRKNYIYTIIHCNADWSASDLIKSEYINGFTEENINDYEFSFNTIQKYTHYKFEFPSRNIKPKISGNYVFKVYDENRKTIFYRRFMVLETKILVKTNVRRATLAEGRSTKHEVDFIIKHPNLIIADPFLDIKVHIKQNNREDNMISDLTPHFVRNDELIYDYEQENIFLGNNEFRHFDFKSLRYHSERIKNIYFDGTFNNVYLFNDIKRTFNQYSITPDINGKFIIKSQESWESAIEADYAIVHFTLPSENINYGDLYLLGDFSDWELKKDFKLSYNTEEKRYEGSVYLKQGYYNYHYALNDTTKNQIDISYIEGTHYQTRNDYFIYVYHRDTGDLYDRLVGFSKSSSKELF